MGLLILEMRGTGCDLVATLRAELMRIRRSEDAFLRYPQVVFGHLVGILSNWLRHHVYISEGYENELRHRICNLPRIECCRSGQSSFTHPAWHLAVCLSILVPSLRRKQLFTLFLCMLHREQGFISQEPRLGSTGRAPTVGVFFAYDLRHYVDL